MSHLPAFPPPTLLSREMADAAEELACRIEHGEFDDLEDTQMADLRMLSALMAQWAEHAQAMEQRLAVAHGSVTIAQRPIAFCN